MSHRLKCDGSPGCREPARWAYYVRNSSSGRPLCHGCLAHFHTSPAQWCRPLVIVQEYSELHVELDIMFLRIAEMFQHSDWDRPVDKHGTGNNPHVWQRYGKRDNQGVVHWLEGTRMCACGAFEPPAGLLKPLVPRMHGKEQAIRMVNEALNRSTPCYDLNCQRHLGHTGMHMARYLGPHNTEMIDEWGESEDFIA